MRAKSLQPCVTLCCPKDHSPPGSPVHGILQARILEQVAMNSSRGSSQPRDWTHFSYVSFIGRWVLYHQHHLGSPRLKLTSSITLTKLVNLCALKWPFQYTTGRLVWICFSQHFWATNLAKHIDINSLHENSLCIYRHLKHYELLYIFLVENLCSFYYFQLFSAF